MWPAHFFPTISGARFKGLRLRPLTIVDAFTREARAIEVDQGINSEQVIAVAAHLALLDGALCAIQVIDGPEFVSKDLDCWACESSVTPDGSRPGRPTNDARAESLNGRLRDECLNASRISSSAEAKSKIETCQRDYNERRPHTALKWRIPPEFVLAAAQQAAE